MGPLACTRYEGRDAGDVVEDGVEDVGDRAEDIVD